MHRAPIVLAATATGLAATLSFHAHEPAASTSTAATSAATTTTATGSSSSSSSSSSGAKNVAAASTTVTSDAITTQYGPVQVKVTLEDGKITAVENVQLPENDPHSSQISDWAGPQLQQSALSHADGTVDAVSGATYTTNGYEQALQSALDKAGLSAGTSSAASAG